jgi:hypothetical protein
VRLGGFEPLAFRVGAERSIQLSYKRIIRERQSRRKAACPAMPLILSQKRKNEKGKKQRKRQFFRLRTQISYMPSEIRDSR